MAFITRLWAALCFCSIEACTCSRLLELCIKVLSGLFSLRGLSFKRAMAFMENCDKRPWFRYRAERGTLDFSLFVRLATERGKRMRFVSVPNFLRYEIMLS